MIRKVLLKLARAVIHKMTRCNDLGMSACSETIGDDDDDGDDDGEERTRRIYWVTTNAVDK